MRVSVRLKPGASFNRIINCDESSVLHIAVKARAVENSANEALVALVAKALKIPKSSVSIFRGHTSRTKVIEVNGIDTIPEDVYGKDF